MQVRFNFALNSDALTLIIHCSFFIIHFSLRHLFECPLPFLFTLLFSLFSALKRPLGRLAATALPRGEPGRGQGPNDAQKAAGLSPAAFSLIRLFAYLLSLICPVAFCAFARAVRASPPKRRRQTP